MGPIRRCSFNNLFFFVAPTSSPSMPPSEIFITKEQPGRPKLLFLSVNANHLPPWPSESTFTPPSPAQAQLARWVDHRYASLPFTPVEPSYTDFSSVLHLPSPQTSIHVVEVDGGWTAPATTVKDYHSLESSLLSVIRALAVNVDTPPLDASPIPSPTQYGYFRRHPSKARAQKAMLNARYYPPR